MKRWLHAILFLLAMVLPSSRALAADGKPPAVTLSIDDKSLPRSPGYHELHGKLQIGDQTRGFACGLFLPRSYFSSTEPMPVVVALHNGGRTGEDGGDKLTGEGLGLLIGRDDGQPTSGFGILPRGAVNLRTEARFICIAPQCPSGYDWSSPDLVPMFQQLIDRIVSAYRADPDRVSLTGFSYGGSQTWLVAMEMPKTFAAIIPLDGRATGDPVHDVRKLMDVSIWLAVGGSDEREGFVGFTEQMRDALVLAGHQKFVFRIVKDGSHYMYPAIYRDPEFLDWLYAQRRFGSVIRPKQKTHRTEPLPTTGPAVTSVSHDSAPAGGSILCMYWREVPGTTLAELTKNPAFPRFPNEQVYLDQMEIPPNQPGNMGTVLRGLITPPATGDYTFFIASDNQGELYLSRDDQRDRIARIAQVKEWSFPRDWTADPAQQSRPVHLSAGQKYFIEARQKNGGGGESPFSGVEAAGWNTRGPDSRIPPDTGQSRGCTTTESRQHGPADAASASGNVSVHGDRGLPGAPSDTAAASGAAREISRQRKITGAGLPGGHGSAGRCRWLSYPGPRKAAHGAALGLVTVCRDLPAMSSRSDLGQSRAAGGDRSGG